MSTKITPDKIIQMREVLLRQGVDDIHLMCSHLWRGLTSNRSAIKLFGVRLCDGCALDISDDMGTKLIPDDDPTPHCTWCRSMTAEHCKCPDRAEND